MILECIIKIFSKKKLMARTSKKHGCRGRNLAIKKANLKTKRYKRDVDQIVLTDLKTENCVKLLN